MRILKSIIGQATFGITLLSLVRMYGADLATKITQTPVFDDPILWIGQRAPSDEDSKPLWDLLQSLASKSPDARTQSVEEFIQQNPSSAWTPSLRTLLGKYHRDTGRYSLALQYWERAWEETKHILAGNGKRVADYTFAHWTRLLGSLGRKEKLVTLFASTEGRIFDRGPLQQIINGTKEGLSLMFCAPGRSYTCGSMALHNLARALLGTNYTKSDLAEAASPNGGFTLQQLVKLADDHNLNLVAVKLKATDDLVVPSVVHWRENHYAAIVGRQGPWYQVKDPTFGHPLLISERNIHAEASGYFLLPANAVPNSVERITMTEAATVRGQGAGNAIPDGPDVDCGTEGPEADGPGRCCGKSANCCSGMPVWSVSEPFATIWLSDEPLGYQPARGSRVSFRLKYKHRETASHSFTFNVGNLWSSSLISHIQKGDLTQNQALLVERGGGEKIYQQENGLSTSNQTVYTALPGWTSLLVRYSDTNGLPLFYVALRDGSTNHYRYTNGIVLGGFQSTRWYLTEQIDPLGNTNRFEYEKTNNTVRLKYLIDADGLTNIFRYTDADISRITEVEDPFARIARLAYDSTGALTQCVDVIGFTNAFAYDAQGILTNLSTPYGNTGFRIQVNPMSGTNFLIRSVEVTTPDGGVQMHAYVDWTTVLPDSFPDSVFPSNHLNRVVGTPGMGDPARVDFRLMNARNSFHWDPRQYQQVSQASRTNLYNLSSNEFKVAHQKHWFHQIDNGRPGDRTVCQVLSMERYPSPDGVVEGQTVWYSYYGAQGRIGANGPMAGDSTFLPGIVAKVLPDGTTNFVWTRRNVWGYPTNVVSSYSVGGTVFERTNALIYSADGRDLLEEWTTNGTTGIRLVGNSYNSNHQMLTSTNAVGEVTTYTYDLATTLMTSRKSSGGLTTTNIYQSSAPHRLLRIVDIEIGRTNSFVYINDLILHHTNELGKVTTYAYDALQRMTNATDGLGSSSSTYDKLDLVAMRDRLGFETRYTYDQVRRKTSEVFVPLSQTNRYNWCSCGSLESMVDALNQTNTYAYNSAGWRTNITYADGSKSVFVHDLLGRVALQRDPAGNWTTNTYNNQGLVTAVAGPVGQLSAMTYDYRDRVTNSVDANGVTNVMTYDDENRLLTRTFPDGGVEKFVYSARGLVAYTNQLTNVTLYGYDEAGRKVAETNANSEVTQFAYDPSGSLTNLLDGKSQRTRWKYDAFGRLTNKLDHLGTNLFFYGYDANSRLTNRWTPGKGNVFYTNDAIGNLTHVTYPSNTFRNLRFQYDGLNRVTNMLDEVGTCAYGYTSFGALASEDGPWADDKVTYAYANQLRTTLSLAQPNASAWTNGYGYDGANRLKDLASPAGAFSYQYVGAGNLVKKLTLPNSAYITNAFDSVARLTNTTLKSSAHAVLNRHSYEVNAGHQRTKQVFTAGNYMDYTYDGAGQLKTAKGKEPDGFQFRALEQLSYVYDSAGNLQFRTNNSLLQTFSVDSLNELTNVTRSGTLHVGGTLTGPATNVTVNSLGATIYDDLMFAKGGFSLVDGTNTFTAIAQDASGRADTNTVAAYLPASVLLIYDLNGNLTTNAARFFEYDDENQLTRITEPSAWKSEFTYDGKMRRRVRKEYAWRNGTWVKTEEVRYVYDVNLVLQERNEFNVATKIYTRGVDLSGSMQGAGGIGGLLAFSQYSTMTPQHSYYHADGNGNVTTLIDANQAVVARYLYDPYGNTLSASGPMADMNPYRFSSKELHLVSGTLYYLYRYYDPTLQRWPNTDPILEIGFRTICRRGKTAKVDRSNLYKFVFNNPITTVDAFGLLGLIGSGCPCGEPLAQINAVGGYYAYRARNLAKEALQAAQNSGLPGLHNGIADAFRHCFWSCRMAQELKAGIAKIIGDTHERCGKNPPGEEAMDLANNAVGRRLGTYGADCRNLCLGAVYEGELVLEPAGTPPGQFYDYTY